MGQINLPDICIAELANQDEVFNSCGLLVKPGIQKKKMWYLAKENHLKSNIYKAD